MVLGRRHSLSERSKLQSCCILSTITSHPQASHSRPISILLRHANNAIRRRKQIKLLTLAPLVLHKPIVPVQLAACLAVHQPSLFASVDGTQRHRPSILERATNVVGVSHGSDSSICRRSFGCWRRGRYSRLWACRSILRLMMVARY